MIVIFPLMPKGVEHLVAGALSAWQMDVIFPLMPKGVEHLTAFIDVHDKLLVIFPLMPKGVEHRFGLFGRVSPGSDFPSDAERR